MRKLASIQRIIKLEPIPNADSIEKATVLGWELVVKKGEFKEGELCVYCEIDSVLPEKPEFEFLRERKFRIRTIKIRGQISQGICFPLSILPDCINVSGEGQDVTVAIGIKKYEPYQEDLKCSKQVSKLIYPSWLPGSIRKILHRFGFIRKLLQNKSTQKSFPSLIPKTDETRIQVLQPLLDKYKGTPCYVTEKLDGSSITIYQLNGKFGVCSRNIDLKKDKRNKYWATVLEHDLEAKFKKVFGKHDVAMQGELIGDGIQGNKYKLKGQDIYFFNLYYIKEKMYGDACDLFGTCMALCEKHVPIVFQRYILSDSIPELVEMSKGKSVLADIQREGIVIRPINEVVDSELHCDLVRNRVSFKSVNPDFLLKYGE